jgi:hypothetical protein
MAATKQREGWYRWEHRDGHNQEYWTAYTASVYRPTYDRPYVSVLLSIANGGGRVLQRFATVSDLRQCVVVPPDGVVRIEAAYKRAMEHLTEISRKLSILNTMDRNPDARLVVPSSGEILSAAEQILRGTDADSARDDE